MIDFLFNIFHRLRKKQQTTLSLYHKQRHQTFVSAPPGGAIRRQTITNNKMFLSFLLELRIAIGWAVPTGTARWARLANLMEQDNNIAKRNRRARSRANFFTVHYIH